MNLPTPTAYDEYATLHKEQDKAVAVFMDMAKNARHAMTKVEVEGGGTVFIAFEPTYVSIVATSEEEYTVAVEGVVVPQVVSAAGQTMQSPHRGVIGLDAFEKKSADDWLEYLKENNSAMLDVARGELENTLFRKESTRGSTIDLRSWGKRQPPLKEAVAVYEKSDSVSRNSSGSMAILILDAFPRDDGRFSFSTDRAKLHISRFAEKRVYRSLGLGGYFGEHAEQIIQDVERIQHGAKVDAFNEIILRHQSSIKWDGLYAENSPAVDKEHPFYGAYGEAVTNYIAESASEDIAKYRFQFVNQCFDMMHNGSPIADGLVADAGERISYLIVGEQNVKYQLEIDEGRFPAKGIAEHCGFPNITKGQFKRAMRIYSEFSASWYDSPVSSLNFHKFVPSDAFAMSKIPSEWFRWDNDIGDVYVQENAFRLQGLSGSSAVEAVNKGMELFVPYLKNTAVELDKLHGIIGSKETSPEDKRSAKLASKEISKKWAWLASADDSLPAKIKKLDDKYKITASYKDYGPLLNDLFKSVLMRTLYDHDVNFEDAFVFDEDGMVLDIEESEVQIAYFADINENRDNDPFYDDELEQYIDAEPVAAEEYMSALSVPDERDLKSLVSKREVDFRVPVKLNDDLHKAHGEFLKEANQGADFNIEWPPLLDEPLDMGEFTLNSIDNRLDLLSEGTMMGHCVFSYLNACIAGESIILSARSNINGERVATIELSHDEDNDGNIVLEIEQCYGPGNSRNEAVDRVEELLSILVESMNNGEVQTNVQAIVDNEELRCDIVDRVSDDPMENGSIVCSVPYISDGAYLAYYTFNKFTPDAMSIESLMSSNSTLESIYESSQFKKDIALIEDYGKEFGMLPVEVVRYKTKHNITHLAQLPVRLQQTRSDINTINQVFNEYGGQLEPTQILQKCQSALREIGREIVADDLVDHNGQVVMDVATLADRVVVVKKPVAKIIQDVRGEAPRPSL